MIARRCTGSVIAGRRSSERSRSLFRPVGSPGQGMNSLARVGLVMLLEFGRVVDIEVTGSDAVLIPP